MVPGSLERGSWCNEHMIHERLDIIEEVRGIVLLLNLTRPLPYPFDQRKTVPSLLYLVNVGLFFSDVIVCNYP